MAKMKTIGEISKLTNLPVRTLHYYDEIGLFKPAYVDEKTKYRYYSESQLYNIDLIKSLKYIGTSLEDIKYAQRLTPEELLQFLAAQQIIVEERLRQMQEVQYTLMRSKKLLEEQINIPYFQEVYEMEVSAQRLLAIKTTDASVLELPDRYFRSLTETVEREGSVMNSRYGGIYMLQDFQSIEEVYYDYLFTPLLTERYLGSLNSDVEVITMPAGRYMCVAFYYNEKTYLENYKILWDAIQLQKRRVKSVVYEVFMPTNFTPEEGPEYIVELKVKI